MNLQSIIMRKFHYDGSCLYNVGDVNYDGDVNIQDIIILIDYIVEEYPITDYAVFDVIPDGVM